MKIINKPINMTNVLTLFNCVVVDDSMIMTNSYNTSLLESHGVVLNAWLSNQAMTELKSICPVIPMTTLYGRKERKNASAESLISKQFLHYVEVYGLGRPGLFDLEVTKGNIVSIRYIQAITREQLIEKIEKLITANAPIDNVLLVKSVIDEYNIDFDINTVANNELRVALFNESKHAFTNGDDAVRYMCFKATGSPLLIKSSKVVAAVGSGSFEPRFFEVHALPLAQVFNRHKRLIIAAKNYSNKTTINRISRLSKTAHVPIRESINKKFVPLALDNKVGAKELATISIRDKFKFLNLLQYKLQQNQFDAFVIRNGKIHIEPSKNYDRAEVDRVMALVLESLKIDLAHLKGKTILLDPNVDYGLPISRKQTFGNLPFGTGVTVPTGKISSGIHWRNEWGAIDLDLSCIDTNGTRTGWGQFSGYDNRNPITFSGDVVTAPDGAMEFVTSGKGCRYGLFVNKYNGAETAEFELVIGRDGKNKWLKDVIIRERMKLDTKGNIIGFVNGNKFTVYFGKLNDSLHSENQKSKAIVSRGTAEFWTVKSLFDKLNITYSVDNNEDTCYDYNMRYEGFSYDKLEELLLVK